MQGSPFAECSWHGSTQLFDLFTRIRLGCNSWQHCSKCWAQAIHLPAAAAAGAWSDPEQLAALHHPSAPKMVKRNIRPAELLLRCVERTAGHTLS
jgi:hypothetical protein